jgi:hypothetical protein
MRRTATATESTFNPIVASLTIASVFGACATAASTGLYGVEGAAPAIHPSVYVAGAKFVGAIPTGSVSANQWVPTVEHFQRLALDLSSVQEDLPPEMRLGSSDYLDYLD